MVPAKKVLKLKLTKRNTEAEVAGTATATTPENTPETPSTNTRRWETVPPKLKTKIATPVTLGLYRNRSAGRIKGNQATFDNSQRNNLRSCVWLSVVVSLRMFVLISLRRGKKPSLISRSVRVRSCDPDRPFSRGNLCSPGGMRGGRTWIPPRCLYLGRNVGGFIGHSRGVDKIDEVLHAPERGVHQSRLSFAP